MKCTSIEIEITKKLLISIVHMRVVDRLTVCTELSTRSERPQYTSAPIWESQLTPPPSSLNWNGQKKSSRQEWGKVPYRAALASNI